MTTEQVTLADQIAALQRCIEWSDHQVNLGIQYAPKKNAALRAVLATLQHHERALAEARQKAYLDAMGCCTPEPGEAWSREAIDAGDLIWGRICDLGNRASRPLTVAKPLVTAYEAGKADAAEQHERAMAVVGAAKRYRDDATGELSTLNALWDALDALDDAASAAGDAG